jgi:hypothetical protein
MEWRPRSARGTGEATHQRHQVWAGALAELGTVLIENDSAHPMELVFDGPMLTDEGQ